MLITVQPNPSWQLSLAQLSPSLFICLFVCPFVHSFIHSLIHQAAILINATHVGDPFNKEGGGYAAKGCEMLRYSAHNQGRRLI